MSWEFMKDNFFTIIFLNYSKMDGLVLRGLVYDKLQLTLDLYAKAQLNMNLQWNIG